MSRTKTTRRTNKIKNRPDRVKRRHVGGNPSGILLIAQETFRNLTRFAQYDKENRLHPSIVDAPDRLRNNYR